MIKVKNESLIFENVYIKTTSTYMFDDTSFFYFDEENMIIYRIRDVGTIDSEKINFQQLQKLYLMQHIPFLM